MPENLVLWLLVLAVPLAALAWSTFEHEIRALRVPRAEILARTAALRAAHGPGALAVAQAKEAAAYARGDALEQGIWRRVARRLRRNASA